VVGEHLIEKTEGEYAKLCSLVADWRKRGALSFDVFVDGTRYYRGPRLFDDVTAALENTARCYRKNLWATQPYFLECWCEKDAVSGILSMEASRFGVQTFVCRGFTSLSSLNNAARTFRDAQRAGKEVTVLYFGDHDPSGRLIDQVAQRTLAIDFGVDVQFRRVAVTPDQIAEMDLPTRPVKAKDTRAKGWQGGCVEIDTIRSADLRLLVEREITALIDPHQWQMLLKTEELERQTLRQICQRGAA
jgi:hypothetical protein